MKHCVKKLKFLSYATICNISHNRMRQEVKTTAHNCYIKCCAVISRFLCVCILYPISKDFLIKKNLKSITWFTVNGGYSPWTTWSACPSKCGKSAAYRSRTRQCNNPKPAFGGRPCVGPPVEKELCPVKLCPGRENRYYYFVSICSSTS